ncbi:MAG: hypothetical protein SYC29_13565 [Planctomycetota bacterium]|nr:hypothetical protein [Planctomycetota bacterium]
MLLKHSRDESDVSRSRVSPRAGRGPQWCALAAAAALVLICSFSAPAAAVPAFSMEQELRPDLGVESAFGYAIDIDDDILVVGAPVAYCDPPTDWSGMCMIYRWDGSEWTLEATLYDEALGYGRFGAAVDVDTSGDVPRVIIGAPAYDGSGGSNMGAAEIWWYDEDDVDEPWKLEKELSDPEGDSGDWFGYSVAIHGTYAIVGSPYCDEFGNYSGSAFVYEYDPDSGWGSGVQIHGEEESFEEFGYSVDVRGNLVLVGAPMNERWGGSRESGVAYVFDVDDLDTYELIRSDYSNHGLFGYDVAVGESILLIGSPMDDIDGETAIGSAYVYENSGSEWVEAERLVASDGAGGDWFGRSVAAGESYLVVGASWNGSSGDITNAGKIYICDASGSYGLQQSLIESWPTADNHFGKGVATSGQKVVAGAPYDNYVAVDSLGVAYVYKRIWFETRLIEFPIEPPYTHGFLTDFTAHIAVGGVTGNCIPQPIIWERTDDGTWPGTVLPDLGHGGQVNSLLDGSQIGDEICDGVVFDDLEKMSAAVWDREGPIWQLTELPMPQMGTESSANFGGTSGATAIVAGHVIMDDGMHGILWTTNDFLLWQHGVLPNLEGGSMGKVNGFVIQPDPDDLVLVGQCKDGDGVMRPVRWHKVGQEYEILPMPMLPDGGPSGIATSIMRHTDGSMTILGRAETSRGAQVPVQWRLIEGTWQPTPMSVDLEPPLSHLNPLAMADEPWPGPIVGFGVNGDDQPEAAIWAPDYAGGQVHNLNIMMDGPETRLTEAVAMNADWMVAVNTVSIDDPDGPTLPAILELLGEPEPCPADFDDDGNVGTADLLHLLGCWGQPCGDVDGDGNTDTVDLLALLGAWGECP